MTGTQWFTQREPGQPITCPGCGHLVTLATDNVSGDSYFPAHGPDRDPAQTTTGSYGLYVTHRSGAHADIHPWARFATRDDAALAARTYQQARGPARQQSFGPVAVKSYPNDAPTMTFQQWTAGGRTRPADWPT